MQNFLLLKQNHRIVRFFINLNCVPLTVIFPCFNRHVYVFQRFIYVHSFDVVVVVVVILQHSRAVKSKSTVVLVITYDYYKIQNEMKMMKTKNKKFNCRARKTEKNKSLTGNIVHNSFFIQEEVNFHESRWMAIYYVCVVVVIVVALIHEMKFIQMKRLKEDWMMRCLLILNTNTLDVLIYKNMILKKYTVEKYGVAIFKKRHNNLIYVSNQISP